MDSRQGSFLLSLIQHIFVRCTVRVCCVVFVCVCLVLVRCKSARVMCACGAENAWNVTCACV